MTIDNRELYQRRCKTLLADLCERSLALMTGDTEAVKNLETVLLDTVQRIENVERRYQIRHDGAVIVPLVPLHELAPLHLSPGLLARLEGAGIMTSHDLFQRIDDLRAIPGIGLRKEQQCKRALISLLQ